jgi:hypothetical protein
VAKVLIIAAAVLALVVVISSGSSFGGNDADATVQLTLAEDQTIDSVRAQISSMASSTWQATRVSESSKDDGESTVVWSLPGTSLDSAVTWLRNERNTATLDAEVEVDVDPALLEPARQVPGEAPEQPEKVQLEVVMVADSGSGPLPMVLLAVVVALAALAGLWFVQGREDESPPRRRRQINRPPVH